MPFNFTAINTLYCLFLIFSLAGCNNLDSAIVKYNKAIELNPGFTKAYGKLGKLYTEKQEFKKAEDSKNSDCNTVYSQTVIHLKNSDYNAFKHVYTFHAIFHILYSPFAIDNKRVLLKL